MTERPEAAPREKLEHTPQDKIDVLMSRLSLLEGQLINAIAECAFLRRTRNAAEKRCAELEKRLADAGKGKTRPASSGQQKEIGNGQVEH